VINGFGALVARLVEELRQEAHPYVDVMGVPDRIIEHAARSEQLEDCGLHVAGIVERGRRLAEHAGVAPARVTA
jgi:deoxyxylulose-5-phosphate synthase